VARWRPLVDHVIDWIRLRSDWTVLVSPSKAAKTATDLMATLAICDALILRCLCIS